MTDNYCVVECGCVLCRRYNAVVKEEPHLHIQGRILPCSRRQHFPLTVKVTWCMGKFFCTERLVSMRLSSGKSNGRVLHSNNDMACRLVKHFPMVGRLYLKTYTP
jgi:hypothetical protein